MHSMHCSSVNSLPAWELRRTLRCRSTSSSSNILNENRKANMWVLSFFVPCMALHPRTLVKHLLKHLCCPAHNGRLWMATKQQCRYPAWKRFSRLLQTPLPILVASLGQRCSKVQTWSNMCTSIRSEMAKSECKTWSVLPTSSFPMYTPRVLDDSIY